MDVCSRIVSRRQRVSKHDRAIALDQKVKRRMATSKLKSKRGFIERGVSKDGEFLSGSSYTIVVNTLYDVGSVALTLTDCNRAITWWFGKPGDKRAVAKIKKVKAVIDSIYDHLVVEK